jgi:hypothetical protein
MHPKMIARGGRALRAPEFIPVNSRSPQVLEPLTGRVLSREIGPSGKPTSSRQAEGNTDAAANEAACVPAQSKTPRTRGTFLRGNREILTSPAAHGTSRPHREGHKPQAGYSACGSRTGPWYRKSPRTTRSGQPHTIRRGTRSWKGSAVLGLMRSRPINDRSSALN